MSWPVVGEYRHCEHGFDHPPWNHSCDGCFHCDVPPEYKRQPRNLRGGLMLKKFRRIMFSSTLAVGLITIGAQTASAIRF